uniref:Uncharacterized protein n=1 Tax=Ixodes ricinus TaxID=34613 RepID=A0A147BUM4_IXORI
MGVYHVLCPLLPVLVVLHLVVHLRLIQDESAEAGLLAPLAPCLLILVFFLLFLIVLLLVQVLSLWLLLRLRVLLGALGNLFCLGRAHATAGLAASFTASLFLIFFLLFSSLAPLEAALALVVLRVVAALAVRHD